MSHGLSIDMGTLIAQSALRGLRRHKYSAGCCALVVSLRAGRNRDAVRASNGRCARAAGKSKESAFPGGRLRGMPQAGRGNTRAHSAGASR